MFMDEEEEEEEEEHVISDQKTEVQEEVKEDVIADEITQIQEEVEAVEEADSTQIIEEEKPIDETEVKIDNKEQITAENLKSELILQFEQALESISFKKKYRDKFK